MLEYAAINKRGHHASRKYWLGLREVMKVKKETAHHTASCDYYMHIHSNIGDVSCDLPYNKHKLEKYSKLP